jgi:hypothetical protein
MAHRIKPRGPKSQAVEEKPKVSDEDRRAMLGKLSELVASKRKANIDWRVNSGIEAIWREDEDAYEGIDDANRHEHAFGGVTSKPGTPGVDPKPSTGCTLLPNITQPYVDTAASKVADMLMPTDERNFVVEPTVEPDVVDEGEGFAPVVPSNPAELQMAQAVQGAIDAAPKPPELEAMEKAVAKLAAVMDQAKRGAKRAQTLIDDYLGECQFQPSVRQAIDDAAKVGTGVIKGPFALKRESTARVRDPQTGEVTEVKKVETCPGSKRIDYWNAFPAPGCGEDIQNGDSFWERDFVTKKQLADLMGGDGMAAYLDDQIKEAIAEGPQKRKAEGINRQHASEIDEKTVFEIWYGYLDLSGAELNAIGCDCDDDFETYPALVTMVNDRIIKGARNPLDSGDFPYDFLPWKRRKGMPWGIGVSRQGRTAQRTYTAAYRNLMDNAGASARPHKISSGVLMQVDGDPWSWTYDPEDTGTPDARAAMQFIIQPSLQQELTAIMAQAERMMEVHTGLPLTVLGLQGTVEETAQGRALLNNNGAAVLRRVARLFDSCLTEPHIGRYYEWLRLYSDDEEIAGGDFRIRARGSSALVERDIQNQQLPVILQLALNPAYGLDPVLAMKEHLKGQRLDSKAFELTAQRKKELLEQQPKPPEPPQIAVAQIREKGATERETMKLQHAAQQADLDRQLAERAQQVDVQLAREDLSAEERAQLQDHKVALAKVVMQLRASPGPQAVTAPTEPAGRAPAGLAFEK